MRVFYRGCLMGVMLVMGLLGPRGAGAQMMVTDIPGMALDRFLNGKDLMEMAKALKVSQSTLKSMQRLKEASDMAEKAVQNVNKHVRRLKKVNECREMGRDIAREVLEGYSLVGHSSFSARERESLQHGFARFTELATEEVGKIGLMLGTSLRMSDYERMQMLDKIHDELSELLSLVRYFKRNYVSSMIYVRSQQHQASPLQQLYGANEVYW